jgi:hypothetical protein
MTVKCDCDTLMKPVQRESEHVVHMRCPSCQKTYTTHPRNAQFKVLTAVENTPMELKV